MSGSQAGVVTFDYSVWGTRYPELVRWVSGPAAQEYFNEATLYLNNTPCSPVSDLTQRAQLLNMLTAHIAALNAALDGQPSPNQVGRISSASEGGVSVSFDMGAGASEAAAWFQQTKYGAAYWRAIAAYRTMRYFASPRPYLGVSRYGRRF